MVVKWMTVLMGGGGGGGGRRGGGCTFRRVTRVLTLLLTLATFIVWLKPPKFFHTPLMLKPIGWKGDAENQMVVLEEGEPATEGVMLLEGYGGQSLTLRMYCAIESAAMVHPNLPVSVLLTAPNLQDTPLYRNLTAVYPNLHFRRLNVPQLFRDSPLQAWFGRRAWEESYWPQSHFNDALRWLLLWRYGGVYLDLDVVVLRPLSSLTNMAARESHKWVAAGVLKFTRDHYLMRHCLREFARHFDGSVWGANGPELLTRVLQERCGLKLPSGDISGCPDLTILPPRSCYPLPWWEWERYVQEDPGGQLTQELFGDPQVLVLHTWHQHSGNTLVNLHSHQPYAAAARVRCPVTVSHAPGVM